MPDIFDPKQIESLSPQEQVGIFRQALENKNEIQFVADLLEFLSNHEHAELRRLAAERNDISEGLIEKLSKDSNSWVRLGIAINPKTGRKLLDQLKNDEKWYVREAAQR